MNFKEDLVGIDIRFDEPLKRYTYTKVGGPADYLAFPRATDMSFLVLSICQQAQHSMDGAW